jgi:hypothetical protein
VFAKVVAYNSYGFSPQSSIGNGAIILTNPDAPVSLAENQQARTASSITFTWSAGAKTGGSPIIDYRISYDNALASWSYLQSGVGTLTFTATGLTPGLTYAFKVEARNSFGYSALSDPVQILCATIPSTPSAPTTSVSNADVIVTWSAPLANGTPILGYRVLIMQSNLIYSSLDSCDGSL